MKNLIKFSIVVIIFFGCKKENTSTAPVQDHVDSSSMVKFDGLFMNGPFGTVTGSAKIYQDGDIYKVALVDVMISNGPDLHVYLSQEEQPVHFIDLGNLRSTSGTQVYSINIVPDFTKSKYYY